MFRRLLAGVWGMGGNWKSCKFYFSQRFILLQFYNGGSLPMYMSLVVNLWIASGQCPPRVGLRLLAKEKCTVFSIDVSLEKINSHWIVDCALWPDRYKVWPVILTFYVAVALFEVVSFIIVYTFGNAPIFQSRGNYLIPTRHKCEAMTWSDPQLEPLHLLKC